MAPQHQCRLQHGLSGLLLLVLPLAVMLLGSGTAFASSRHTLIHPVLGLRAVGRSGGARRRKSAVRARSSVIGGSSASTGTFPELAFISDTSEEEDFACTGTVVAANLILTAAHCAEDLETGFVHETAGYTVITGNVNRNALARQVSAVSKVIVYPGFAPSVLDRDAALLVLATPTTAPAVPLWTATNAGTLAPGRAAEIVGWGREYYEQEGLPQVLKWADTAVQSPEWCAHNALDFYGQDELCTINPPSYGTGACHGDSGGPLLVSSPEGPVEIGITSHIYGECSTAEPTIFTRTDILIPWVHEWAEAEKPSVPAPAPTPPPPNAPVPRAAPTRPPAAPAPAVPPPSPEGVYRGSTSQTSTPISVVVGAGGRRVTALATKVLYRCRSGHSITEPMEGLSNGEPEPITATHTFTVTFSGAESETITGAIDAADGEMSGTLSARWQTHRYGLCSTGRISWSAQRSQVPLSSAPLAGAGNYHGWTNQGDHILITVANEGRQLTDVQFSAQYECPHHHSLHLTESFLSPSEPWPIESSFATFTVNLGGHGYSGRVDGAFALGGGAVAFGSIEASTVTRYGRCRTGLVPWTTKQH
jgi:hypothetical protein